MNKWTYFLVAGSLYAALGYVVSDLGWWRCAAVVAIVGCIDAVAYYDAMGRR